MKLEKCRIIAILYISKVLQMVGNRRRYSRERPHEVYQKKDSQKKLAPSVRHPRRPPESKSPPKPGGLLRLRAANMKASILFPSIFAHEPTLILPYYHCSSPY